MREFLGGLKIKAMMKFYGIKYNMLGRNLPFTLEARDIVARIDGRIEVFKNSLIEDRADAVYIVTAKRLKKRYVYLYFENRLPEIRDAGREIEGYSLRVNDQLFRGEQVNLFHEQPETGFKVTYLYFYIPVI